MKKTYCTRLNFPWNSEKRFFGRSSTSINFGASQSACDVMKLNTLELSFDVEQIYILNRCDWMKNEENILYTLWFSLKSRKTFFRKRVNFNKFWRAPERTWCYDVEYIAKFIWYRASLHFKSMWLDESWRKYICHNVP